jgi:integrase
MMKKTSNGQKSSIVERHNIRIPILKRVDVKNGKQYQGFFFNHVINGKRFQKRFRTLEKARCEAIRLIELQAGDKLGKRTLSELEFADYTTAIQILRRHQGQSLSTVVSEWDAAAKALGGESIVAACEAQANANRKKNGFKPTLLSRVYDQFLEGLKRDAASVRYIEDCRSRMGQIKDTFRGYIHNVDMADLEAWLNTKKISIKTRKNYRTAAVTLWAFAKSNGYLPREHQTEAELLPNRKRTKAAKLVAEIGVYDASALRKILSAAPPHLLPVFAIGAFAGLRSAEIHRLKWGDIHPSFIQVDADDSKNAVRRHAPVTVAFKEWLSCCNRGDDDARICERFSHENALARAMTKAIRDAGVEPVHNGLRHTFCSARVAVTNDVKQTSREAGNTPAVILKHYVRVLTRAKGAAWFNVRPKASSEKVIPIAA